jgi:hypothetical protein
MDTVPKIGCGYKVILILAALFELALPTHATVLLDQTAGTTNFTDISSPIIISGSGDATTNYVDSGGATNSPSRYYRIRLVP